MVEYVVSLDKLGVHDVEHVGGKNASLGEMISNLAGAGVSVPGGFATTAQAYRDFLELSGLNKQIHLSLIHISEPTRPRLISYAVFCLKKKKFLCAGL